jgi:hypothetical protein
MRFFNFKRVFFNFKRVVFHFSSCGFYLCPLEVIDATPRYRYKYELSGRLSSTCSLAPLQCQGTTSLSSRLSCWSKTSAKTQSDIPNPNIVGVAGMPQKALFSISMHPRMCRPSTKDIYYANAFCDGWSKPFKFCTIGLRISYYITIG